MERPRLVPGTSEPPDVRVVAVREVLAGERVPDVARRHDVDVAVLHRWVAAFVDAGTAAVTNRPTADDHRQRDRFLAAFAHETRTPLTTARGWVDMLREEEVPQSMLTPTLAKLDDALTRLAERSRDIELMASAALGLLRPRAGPVSFAELTTGHGTPGASQAYAATRLVVDPDLMQRVLRDLWRAAELPPVPDAVAWEAQQIGPWTELRVVRTGPPMDHSTLQTLFEPFDLNHDGSGITIGLYLARTLAVAHGGTVGVHQDEETTTFWVRVPKLHPASPEADEHGVLS
ncbi:histidine kinase dimerization/phospho-acceptor domain-containing protein [Nocardioides sp.]|uniref:histidine kinase dimerization/phospho-acceptor domain-containing protein n=1 Tax=Nocardioides sp. TaxID=35761 RepID=UPI002B61F293|nr:histidine kinase dimerization/phospho-acceptor domain-containing protein [Nocardioides sp.]HXH77489.1 histidine kinase dimerization/phospho-acceptor domain-containing protein [Nocardioides sp.]